MYSKYNDVEIQLVIDHYLAGSSVADIVSETKIPRSTVYAWIRKAAEQNDGKEKISLKSYRLLENQVVRLKGCMFVNDVRLKKEKELL